MTPICQKPPSPACSECSGRRYLFDGPTGRDKTPCPVCMTGIRKAIPRGTIRLDPMPAPGGDCGRCGGSGGGLGPYACPACKGTGAA